jgi:hypothetical protein
VKHPIGKSYNFHVVAPIKIVLGRPFFALRRIGLERKSLEPRVGTWFLWAESRRRLGSKQTTAGSHPKL